MIPPTPREFSRRVGEDRAEHRSGRCHLDEPSLFWRSSNDQEAPRPTLRPKTHARVSESAARQAIHRDEASPLNNRSISSGKYTLGARIGGRESSVGEGLIELIDMVVDRVLCKVRLDLL